jgi:hypothetical protein
VAIDSTLDVGAGTHALRRARTSGDAVTIDLAASARPVVVANDVAVGLGDGPAPMVTLGAHAFTLRLGSLLGEAFDALGHVPADGRLGKDVLVSAGGCASVSQTACAAAGLPASCLTAACNASIATLDGVLARPFVWTDGAALDFRWSGVATAMDAEPDLAAEAFTLGLWSATLTTADATTLSVTGTFEATAEAE